QPCGEAREQNGTQAAKSENCQLSKLSDTLASGAFPARIRAWSSSSPLSGPPCPRRRPRAESARTLVGATEPCGSEGIDGAAPRESHRRSRARGANAPPSGTSPGHRKLDGGTGRLRESGTRRRG